MPDAVTAHGGALKARKNSADPRFRDGRRRAKHPRSPACPCPADMASSIFHDYRADLIPDSEDPIRSSHYRVNWDKPLEG